MNPHFPCTHSNGDDWHREGIEPNSLLLPSPKDVINYSLSRGGKDFALTHSSRRLRCFTLYMLQGEGEIGDWQGVS